MPVRQANKYILPLGITGPNELPLPPAAPTAAAICHRAEPLPSVHSNSFAIGRIWHSHKGPLFVPEVGHTMQSFPLVTQSWVSTAGLETFPDICNPQTQALSPSPTGHPSFHVKYWGTEETREQSPLLGALIPANSNLTCSKVESEGVLELCPQSLCRTFATWILQDHLNIRLSNFQVYSFPQEARNLADRSDLTTCDSFVPHFPICV